MTTQNTQISGRPESEELQKVKAKLAQAEQEITAYDMTMNRQSKLIAELEAQLEAVGAGGVEALISNAERKSAATLEPFGYFKSEPFGWTDCAETDEGAIALYEAPQPAAQALDAWQPIATAPKDGSEILLRSAKGRIANGMWSAANERSGFWAWAYVHQEPVEWMPLPSAQAQTMLAAAPQPQQIAEPASHAAKDVLAERQRQINVEGWTPEFDDDRVDGQLAGAASCYAQHVNARSWVATDLDNGPEIYRTEPTPDNWPWDESWWKPTTPRRDAVKACALLLAEIERIDRATNHKEPS